MSSEHGREPDRRSYWNQSRVLWTIFFAGGILVVAALVTVQLIFMYLRSQRGF